MRILYDGMIYLLQQAGGVNRYFNNLISRLPNDDIPCLTIYQPRGTMLPVHTNLQIINYPRYAPGFICSALRPVFFQMVNLCQRPDIAHPTYYGLLSGQSLISYRCPVVITVYDMILEKFADQLDPTGRNREIKRRAVRAADVVICISENTKQDLLEWHTIKEDKIQVIPLASELSLASSNGSEAYPQRPYFLYVGGRDGYKNFDGLLKSFARISMNHNDIGLCVVGPAFSETERLHIAELKLTDRIEYFGHASDGQLARLYHHSIALVYPSLYEGFGIPPLEAMCCGTPVIACNTSSIPEVVGQAGLLYDQKAPDELTELLVLLIENGAEREKRILQGYEQSKRFSWDRTARQTVEVYRALAGKGDR